MIFPCIDLMDGKVVQLVQGREKALEGDSPEEMLRKFAGFPEIQVIDLDAAMGRGSNDELVECWPPKPRTRVGGGVRTARKGAALLDLGVGKVIVGTSAFLPGAQLRLPAAAPVRRAAGSDPARARFERRPHRGEGLAGVA